MRIQVPRDEDEITSFLKLKSANCFDIKYQG
jgi:hypothetical protein